MVLTGQTLTPANVFMLLSFMGVIKFSGMLNMTSGLMVTYDAYVSLGRIEEFLLLENLLQASESDLSNEPQQKAKSTATYLSRSYLKKEEENTEKVSLSRESRELGPTILSVSNLSYAKTHHEEEFILEDINFFAPSKSLTVITGPVGSGKSTLLSAIAGEIWNTSGTIDYQGSLIYLPQTAWVFSGTIKENILFGQPYKESNLMSTEAENTYQNYACALAMCLNGLIGGLCMHQRDYRCEILGIRIGSALRGLVYHKTLLLSKKTLLRFTAGRLFDLISNDVKRMEEETVNIFFSGVFAVPVYAGATFLIYNLIGWQAVTGVFLLCILMPYFAVLSYANAKLRLRTAAVSDERISLMNQVVSGIRAVKMHAWEDEYGRKIKNVRR
ncbi:multidrug resistance-associated protein 4-like [Pocillopora damicornis]|uniref:multidrug resistance-associated protein 4-like n=1 Tax=Pocillopora damicornis TaxID=46731 RepID=UPI000F55295D|nr:multidrug resistance-associated protein 4-like [Pocillopora damicornis]